MAPVPVRSRRALAVAGALLVAAAPAAEGRRARPLAFAAVSVGGVSNAPDGGGGLAFAWAWQGTYIAPGFAASGSMNDEVTLVAPGEDATRRIVAEMRAKVADRLDQFAVPPDRIEVTVL